MRKEPINWKAFWIGMAVIATLATLTTIFVPDTPRSPAERAECIRELPLDTPLEAVDDECR